MKKEKTPDIKIKEPSSIFECANFDITDEFLNKAKIVSSTSSSIIIYNSCGSLFAI
jgi:hypothetical protein